MLTLQKLSPENCFILDIVPQSSSRTVFVDSTWVETQLLNTGGLKGFALESMLKSVFSKPPPTAFPLNFQQGLITQV
jgi:hypothetical protein